MIANPKCPQPDGVKCLWPDCQNIGCPVTFAVGGAWWRKELPDQAGMWLAAFFESGRWWLEILAIHTAGAQNNRADETWWYLGPIKFPNAQSQTRGPAASELAQARGSALAELAFRTKRLMEIVEGWRRERWQSNGRRLIDTPEWCAFYVAHQRVEREAPNAEVSDSRK